MNETVEAFKSALLMIDRPAARDVLQEAIARLGVQTTLEELITTALSDIGHDWEEGRLALSQIYMAGRICEELIDYFLPLEGVSRNNEPRLGIAVYEDYHMLGKRLVYSVLRSTGHDVIDYGRIDLESALRLVGRDRIEVLFLSVLMLPSALHIGELRRKLDQAGLPVKIVVGGAPFRFDAGLWREVGADAMGRTASDAATILRELSGGAP